MRKLFMILVVAVICFTIIPGHKRITVTQEVKSRAPFPDSVYSYTQEDTINIFKAIKQKFNDIVYFFELNF